jgi:hypothetical protein
MRRSFAALRMTVFTFPVFSVPPWWLLAASGGAGEAGFGHGGGIEDGGEFIV